MTAKYIVGIVSLLVIVSTAAFFVLPIWRTDTRHDTDRNTVLPRNGTMYTLEEVALHDSAKDCWMAIEGRVYDVTEYIEDRLHPGGASVLLGCGRDATELYMTRPMGSNTPHSEEARQDLEQYYLGELE